MRLRRDGITVRLSCGFSFLTIRDVDLAEIARDQIERRIASAFTGHDFTRLVAEILKAQGYLVNVSPPGADNGIDIVAGRDQRSS